MAAFVVCLALFLAMSGSSSATYCICKDGESASALQKNIDYACGAGADCTPIIENGSCYNPNTLKDHCNYAVNSYYQRRNQANGTCDFSGTAITSQTISNQSSGCVYPSSPSTAGSNSTAPSTSPTPTTTPTTTTPTTGTTLSPPSTSTGGTGSTTSTNSQATARILHQNPHYLFWSLTPALLLSGSYF